MSALHALMHRKKISLVNENRKHISLKADKAWNFTSKDNFNYLKVVVHRVSLNRFHKCGPSVFGTKAFTLPSLCDFKQQLRRNSLMHFVVLNIY